MKHSFTKRVIRLFLKCFGTFWNQWFFPRRLHLANCKSKLDMEKFYSFLLWLIFIHGLMISRTFYVVVILVLLSMKTHVILPSGGFRLKSHFKIYETTFFKCLESTTQVNISNVSCRYSNFFLKPVRHNVAKIWSLLLCKNSSYSKVTASFKKFYEKKRWTETYSVRCSNREC